MTSFLSPGLTNDEDSCQAIVGLRFVNGDDCDTILVRIQLFYSLCKANLLLLLLY